MLPAGGRQHRGCIIPHAVTHSLVLLKVGKIYQWCTVKQMSDNEIYLLIMYIKIVLWRVAKRLSCIVYARCLRVNQCLYLLSERTQLLEHYAFICYLPHVSAVSGRHQVDITTTCMEKPSLQNFSCCTSTRFRVTAHPYGASRSYSLATLTSVGLF
jgi:hypothetical protein